MLIFFSAAFGAPLLFGISSYIVGVLGEQTANIGISPEEIEEYTAQSPALRLVGIPSIEITEEFVVFFAEIALFTTCLFAAMVLGVISTGKEKGGVKYLPILLAIAFALFFISRGIMEQVLGNLGFII
jgi:hypothetical protein